MEITKELIRSIKEITVNVSVRNLKEKEKPVGSGFYLKYKNQDYLVSALHMFVRSGMHFSIPLYTILSEIKNDYEGWKKENEGLRLSSKKNAPLKKIHYLPNSSVKESEDLIIFKANSNVVPIIKIKESLDLKGKEIKFLGYPLEKKGQELAYKDMINSPYICSGKLISENETVNFTSLGVQRKLQNLIKVDAPMLTSGYSGGLAFTIIESEVFLVGVICWANHGVNGNEAFLISYKEVLKKLK